MTDRAARWVASCAAAIAFGVASPASAQLADVEQALDEGIELGDWRLRPELELRVRGEYRRDPAEVGGDVFSASAVQLDDFRTSVPPIAGRAPAVRDQWLVGERSRLGLAAESEHVAALLLIEDARVLGVLPGAPDAVDRGGHGRIAPYQAWAELRTADGPHDRHADPALRARLGRQRVVWGDGRLVGASEWAPQGPSLDALTVRCRMPCTEGKSALSDLSIEVLGALLAPPGAVPPPYAPGSAQIEESNLEGTGAQLYGLDAVYRIVPIVGVELTALGRVVRPPLGEALASGDTFTVDGRVFGEQRGFEYSAEGAYQLGRAASYGQSRDVSAFAAAARASWLTALPGHLRFSAQAAYASGDDSGGDPASDLHRFDPIVPDVRAHGGLMGLHAWSNAFGGSFGLAAQPIDELNGGIEYGLRGLAEPTDRWQSSALRPIGAAPGNDERVLGHEIDAELELRPWPIVALAAGYGLMALGDGGRAVLTAAGHGAPDLLHYGYAQASLAVP